MRFMQVYIVVGSAVRLWLVGDEAAQVAIVISNPRIAHKGDVS